jgi:hypothetical protein
MRQLIDRQAGEICVDSFADLCKTNLEWINAAKELASFNIFEECLCSMKFSRANSCVKMWRSADISGTNSVPIFRVCWWFGSTTTVYVEIYWRRQKSK